jgi:hypothetical protein
LVGQIVARYLSIAQGLMDISDRGFQRLKGLRWHLCRNKELADGQCGNEFDSVHACLHEIHDSVAREMPELLRVRLQL